MSRILRRPMFRGGKVSSYGNGIATGLANGGMASKRGLVDGPGGYNGTKFGGRTNNLAQSPYDSGRTTGSGKGLTKGTRTSRLATQLRSLFPLINQGIRGIGLNPATGYAALTAGAPVGLAYLNRAKTDKGLQFMKDADPSIFDETAMPTIGDELGEMQAYGEGLAKANEQGNKISFMDNFFLDPKTGTYPKFMGRSSDREKLAAIAEENNIDDFETDGSAAGVREGESALDAVMREAYAKKNNLNDPNPKLDNDPNDPNNSKISKDSIKKYKDMFREAYGSGKADDISSMLMNFAGKALKPEATVKGAFGEFFEEESKRPSKRKQYDEAAATAAINAYIAGEKSMADTKKALAIYDKKLSKASAAENSKTIVTRMNEDRSSRRANQKLIGHTAEFMEDQNLPGVPQQITKEQAEDPKLLVEENIGAVFIDTDSNKVFIIVADSNGKPIKRELYSG